MLRRYGSLSLWWDFTCTLPVVSSVDYSVCQTAESGPKSLIPTYNTKLLGVICVGEMCTKSWNLFLSVWRQRSSHGCWAAPQPRIPEPLRDARDGWWAVILGNYVQSPQLEPQQYQALTDNIRKTQGEWPIIDKRVVSRLSLLSVFKCGKSTRNFFFKLIISQRRIFSQSSNKTNR